MPAKSGRDVPVVDPVALSRQLAPAAPATEDVPLPAEDATITEAAETEGTVVPAEVVLGTSNVRPANLEVPRQDSSPVGLDEPDRWSCTCLHINLRSSKFCTNCGTSLASLQVRRCPDGHVCAPSVKFCGECGQKVDQDAVAISGVAAELAGQVITTSAELRPRPAAELTEEELAERQRQHAEAVRLGRSMPAVQYAEPAQAGERVVLHILSDGFTFAGQVWYVGQEMWLDVGSVRWQQAQAWMRLTDFEQIEAYGEIKFRLGPWPGKKYVDGLGSYQQLGPMSKQDGAAKVTGPQLEELERADQLEARRRGAVPMPVL